MKTFKQFVHEATLNKMIRNTQERDTRSEEHTSDLQSLSLHDALPI